MRTPEQEAVTLMAAVDNTLSAVKGRLTGRLKGDAERVRLQYITPGSGKALSYIEKREQAVAVHDLGQDAANALTEIERVRDYPTLSAGVGIEAPTLWDCAQIVIRRAEAWSDLSYSIERIEAAGAKAIAEATTADAASAAYEAVIWTM